MKRDEFLGDKDQSLQLMLKGERASLWTAIPAIIQKVDYESLTVEAIPAIQGTIEDENGEQKTVNLPLLVDIPLLLPHGGKWHITIPVQVGDECLIVFSSRCIDAWWQLGDIQKPLEKRMHDLSDALCILAPYSKPKASELNTISSNSILIRNTENNNYIEFTDDGDINILQQKDYNQDTNGNSTINIKGNNTINIDGNNTVNIKGTCTSTIDGDLTLNNKANTTINVNGNANINVDGNTQLKSPNTTLDSEVKITKNLTVQGNINANGSLGIKGSGSISGDLVASGVSVKSHRHQEQGDGKPTSPPI